MDAERIGPLAAVVTGVGVAPLAAGATSVVCISISINISINTTAIVTEAISHQCLRWISPKYLLFVVVCKNETLRRKKRDLMSNKSMTAREKS